MELLRILKNAITFLVTGLVLQILVYSKIVKKWNNCPLQFDAIHLVPKVSLGECLKQCYIRKHCQLICYRTKLTLCEIYDTMDNTENCKSCLSVIRDDIHTEEFETSCECGNGLACDTLIGSCGNTECGKLSDPLQVIKGNLAYVGAKKIAGCKNGYNSTLITCGSDGEWENLPTCKICPIFGDMIRVANTYQMKIFNQTVTQQEAKDNCEDACGILARMNESTKIDALREEITSSSDFTFEGYWVDGYSTHPEDLNSWKFSDGAQMPMKKKVFWYHIAPNHNTQPACVRLTQRSGYLMDDNDCDLQLHYICEL